jgi:uncharacterized membrane protein YjdF
MDSTIRPVFWVTTAYLAVAAPFALMQNNTEFLFYIAVVVVLGAGIVLLHRTVRLSAGVLWALSLWGLLHMLGGLARVPASWPTENDSGVLYSLWLVPGWLKYDNPVHAFGFAVATQVCWECLRTVPGVRPTWGILLLCMLAGMGLGSLNEIVEFSATLLMPQTNVGGYVNTGWDLVANMVGALTTVLLIRFRREEPRMNTERHGSGRET